MKKVIVQTVIGDEFEFDENINSTIYDDNLEMFIVNTETGLYKFPREAVTGFFELEVEEKEEPTGKIMSILDNRD